MSTEQPGTDVFEEIDPDPDAVLAEFGVDSLDELATDGGAHDPTTDDEISEALRASSSRTQSDDDVDDTTAAELFADLADHATDSRATDPADRGPDDGVTDAPVDSTDGDAPSGFEEFEAAVVAEPTVAAREDEGLVESTAAELNAVAERVVGSDETAAADETEAPLESQLRLETEAPTPTDSDASTAVDEGDSGPVADTRSAAETDTRDAARSDDSASDRSLTLSYGTTDELELVGPEPTTTRVGTDAFGRTGADGS
ncbi:hypothetical protein [Natrinema versiforme]|nr:hypothetical protein [Natrinema versiforme]